jgi:hypothetical protein
MPKFRAIPFMKILAMAEIALLARRHFTLLTPRERGRLVQLIRKAKGRPSNLTKREQDEFSRLVQKAEPRRFAMVAADKLSPVGVPKRLTKKD